MIFDSIHRRSFICTRSESRSQYFLYPFTWLLHHLFHSYPSQHLLFELENNHINGFDSLESKLNIIFMPRRRCNYITIHWRPLKIRISSLLNSVSLLGTEMKYFISKFKGIFLNNSCYTWESKRDQYFQPSAPWFTLFPVRRLLAAIFGWNPGFFNIIGSTFSFHLHTDPFIPCRILLQRILLLKRYSNFCYIMYEDWFFSLHVHLNYVYSKLKSTYPSTGCLIDLVLYKKIYVKGSYSFERLCSLRTKDRVNRKGGSVINRFSKNSVISGK